MSELPKCKKCGDKKYISKVQHIDGGHVFETCECTGLTKEKLEAFADAIRGKDIYMESSDDQA